MSRWIPSHERGIANGLIFAGVGIGAGITPPLITYCMVRYGWRSSFWVCALIGVVAGSVWYLSARDTPEEDPRVSASELATIRSGLTVDAARTSGALVPWGRILASKAVWALTLSYFCYGYVAWIFFSWFYIYLAKVRGLNLKASAFYAMLPFLAMAVGCPLGGLISDRLTKSARQTVRALRPCRFFDCVGRSVSCFRLQRGECAPGKHSPLGWRRRSLPIAKLLLVRDCGYRWRIVRLSFRPDEYGRADGRSRHSFAYPLDCVALRLDRFVCGCGGLVCCRCIVMVNRRSRSQLGSSERTISDGPGHESSQNMTALKIKAKELCRWDLVSLGEARSSRRRLS